MPYVTTLLSLLTVCLLGCGRGPSMTPGGNQPAPLVIYCAAGIRLPVEEMTRRYAAEFNQPVQIDYGSSGELEGRLEIERRTGKHRCDLYIPADASFGHRAHQKGLTEESLAMAEFRLVLATKPDADGQIESVQQLLDDNSDYVLCAPKAGAGKKTMQTLQKFDLWAPIEAGKKVAFPRVTEAANAIKSAPNIRAGFIWDTTAKQFGLQTCVPREIEDAVSLVTIHVVSSTERPTAALRLARYMCSTDHSHAALERFGFVPAGQDAWDPQPEIVLYCGGVNRNAIEKTIADFQQREGVSVQAHYGGCGTLVTGIQSAESGASQKGMPDAFMTCDASYMDKVQTLFGPASDVSSTRVVMVVRRDNPHSLQRIEDLAKPELAIGTTNPKLSTLGDLTWQLFEQARIKDTIEHQQSVQVMAPTAHELILQMTGHDKLDVVLAYHANCLNLPDGFEIVPVPSPTALAVQNIATAKSSRFPALTQRLIQAVQSTRSQQRFELNGFQWRVVAEPAPE